MISSLSHKSNSIPYPHFSNSYVSPLYFQVKNVGRLSFPLVNVHLYTDYIPKVNGDLSIIIIRQLLQPVNGDTSLFFLNIRSPIIIPLNNKSSVSHPDKPHLLTERLSAAYPIEQIRIFHTDESLGNSPGIHQVQAVQILFLQRSL